MASDNHTFRSGLLDLLAMQMDSSHAAGSVCASHKWLYAREVMMLRGNGCATSLSIWVAGAFPFALSGMSTHTHARAHTQTHAHTCAHTHMHAHACVRTHTVHTRRHVHTDVCTHVHTHAHTYMPTPTHAHALSWSSVSSLSPPSPLLSNFHKSLFV